MAPSDDVVRDRSQRRSLVPTSTVRPDADDDGAGPLRAHADARAGLRVVLDDDAGLVGVSVRDQLPEALHEGGAVRAAASVVDVKEDDLGAGAIFDEGVGL